MALVINGTTYNGLPNGTGSSTAWQPTGYVVRQVKIGTTLEAADGTRNRVERSVTKREWDLTWEKCNNATRLTLTTLAAVYTTFSMTDFDGNVYTCFIDAPFEPEWQYNTPAGAAFWNCKLTIRQT